MLLTDIDLAVLSEPLSDKPLIVPFEPNLINTNAKGVKIISYGLSSMGYDVRLTDTVKLFTNTNSTVVDPILHDSDCFVDAKILNTESGLRYFILPPNSYALGNTVETFNLPKSVLATVMGKSTYARAGLIINTTVIEPGFSGTVVIELANGTTLPIKVYLDGGIAQFIFFKSATECAIGYNDRKGKYQNQSGLVFAKV